MRCIESTTTYRSSLERVDLSYVACTGTCTCTCTCSVENEQLSVVSYSLWRIWLSESQSKFLHTPSSPLTVGIRNVFTRSDTSFAGFKPICLFFVYVFRSFETVLSDGRSFSCSETAEAIPRFDRALALCTLVTAHSSKTLPYRGKRPLCRGQQRKARVHLTYIYTIF